MLSIRDIQALHELRCEEQPVLSLYVDLCSPPGAAAELKRLLKEALPRVPGLRDRQGDLDRAAKLLAFDHAGARALAVFSCGDKMWLDCPLPQPVKTLVRLGPTPYLAPLLNMVDQCRRYGVLLLSPERARFVEVFFGQADELPSSPASPARPGHGSAVLKAAADQLMGHVRTRGLERLILSAPPGWESPMIGHLHTFIQDNLIVDSRLRPDMTLEEIREAVALGESQSRAVRESVLVYRLLDAARSGESGVVGLSPTLQALNRGAARMLLVRDSLARMGRRCAHCGWLGLSGKKCLSCWLDTEPVINLVSEMIQLALDQNCEVFRLMHDARLDAVGGVGAELRARLEPAPAAAAPPVSAG